MPETLDRHDRKVSDRNGLVRRLLRTEARSSASARIVPGEPSGSSTTSKSTLSRRLKPMQRATARTTGCVVAVTRTSHGSSCRRCCQSVAIPCGHWKEPRSSSVSGMRPSKQESGCATSTAAELVETLFRGLADNSVGQGHRADPPGRGRHRRRAWLRSARRCRGATAVPVRRRGLRARLGRHRQPLAI